MRMSPAAAASPGRQNGCEHAYEAWKAKHLEIAGTDNARSISKESEYGKEYWKRSQWLRCVVMSTSRNSGRAKMERARQHTRDVLTNTRCRQRQWPSLQHHRPSSNSDPHHLRQRIVRRVPRFRTLFLTEVSRHLWIVAGNHSASFAAAQYLSVPSLASYKKAPKSSN